MKNISSFLLLTVLLTGCQTHKFESKHFPERIARIHSIGILPQIHTAILDSYFGLDKSPAAFPEESRLRSELIGSAIDQLQRRGFVIVELSPSETNQICDGRMIQSSFVQRGKVPRPEAVALAGNAHVDGVCFLEAKAFKSTAHRQNITSYQNFMALFGYFGGGDISVPLNSANVQITLVDGNTGDVLWWSADYFKDFEKKSPAQAVDYLFSLYPKPND